MNYVKEYKKESEDTTNLCFLIVAVLIVIVGAVGGVALKNVAKYGEKCIVLIFNLSI